MTISLYDAVMLVIVCFGALQGAWRGMAWQLAPIASIVLGYMFAVPLSASTAPWFGEPPLNRVFAMITMYILVSLGVYLIARAMRESIERTKMVEFDRHLGALLGAVKGVLFTVVLTVGLVAVSPTAAALIVNSESRTVAEYVINFTSPLLPADLHEVIDPYLKPIENLPDDEDPKAVSKRAPAARDRSHTPTAKESASARTRRHDPIFEDDDLLNTRETAVPSDEDLAKPPAHRRRSSGPEASDPLTDRGRKTPADSDTSSFDAAEEDAFIGADPNRIADEPGKARRR